LPSTRRNTPRWAGPLTPGRAPGSRKRNSCWWRPLDRMRVTSSLLGHRSRSRRS
jgi:hypothetical protein